MAETEFRLKATGAEEVKKTFKTVVDYAKQLDRFAAKPSLSNKEMDAAKRALEQFNREKKKTVELIKNEVQEMRLYKKLLEDNAKIQGNLAKFSPSWHEANRRARYLERGLSKSQQRITNLGESYQIGSRAGENIEGRQETSSGGGFGSRLGAYVLGGIGLGTAMAIGKKSLAAAMSVNDNLIDMASSLRFRDAKINRMGSYTSNDQISDLVESIQGKGPEAVGGIGQALGFNRQQISEMGAGFAKTGAFAGGSESAEGLVTMMNMQRRFGIDPSSFMGLGSSVAKGGRNLTSTDMKTVTAQAFASGLQQARFGEFADSISSLVQQMQQQGTASSDPRLVGGMLSLLGQGGNPMLQGSRGASALGQLNQSLVSPGGGIAGQLSMLNIAGFGRSGMSFWESRKRLSAGFSDPKTGKQMFMNMLKQARSYGPEGSEQYLSYVGGLDPNTAAAIMKEDKGGRLESSISGMNKGGFSRFLNAKGLGSLDIQDTLTNLKEKGLGPALLAVNTRAASANAFEDLGQNILNVLAIIASNTGKMAHIPMGDSSSKLKGRMGIQ